MLSDSDFVVYTVGMLLPIHYYGDPILRQKAEPIASVDDEIRELAARMVDTMRAESGLGLAAQQVGRTVALCIVDLPADMDENDDGIRENPDVDMPMILINPEVEMLDKKSSSREEGCLSFPGIHGYIERPWRIRVRYQTETGEQRDVETQGLLARVIQHEVDHLNGVLFIDRMSPVKKLALKGRLRRLRQETEEVLADEVDG